MHFTLVPRIDDSGRVRVSVVDSSASGMAPALWNAAKRHLHPRLERFSYDLGASRDALAALLRGAAPPVHAAAMELALQRLSVLAPKVAASHVLVPIAIDVPDAWLAAAPSASAAAGASAPLTEAELEALEKAFEPWDAFLVTIVRQIATDGDDDALRGRLFTLLLDSRYRLSAMLAGEEPVVQDDPLRTLFLETWSELRAILLEAQRAGTLPPSLLRYALFIDAADALAAVEAAAPGLPLSPDGLRQLARSLKPGEGGDPLAYDWAVDPELGRLFGVEEIPQAEPAPASEPAAPPARSWLDLFVSRAYADEPQERWVPTREELPAYGTRIAGMLQKSAASEAQRAGFDCYAYNPMLANAAIFLSAWDQGIATGHVGMDKIFDYLAATGYPVGEPQGPDTFFFCNYFVANDRFWRGYFSYCEAILYALEQEAAAGRQAGLAYIGHGNYARDKNTSMRPFVIERLLGLYIASARTSGLKVAGFVPQAEDFARKFGDRMGSALFDLWSKKNDGIAGEGASRFETWKEARFAIASQPILALHADDPPAWLPRINKL